MNVETENGISNQRLRWRDTWQLWKFGFFKVRLILMVRPRVLELNSERAEIMIPLNRRTRNHLHSMYFGVLCIGADIAGGLQLMPHFKEDFKKVSFIFKDFTAEFLKRPEADVHFICEDGVAINNMLQKAKQSGEREQITVQIIATTPTLLGNEPIARFQLTLSMKRNNALIKS